MTCKSKDDFRMLLHNDRKMWPIFFFLAFSLTFLIPTQNTRKKNTRKLNLFSILYYALSKNASLLRFSRVFAHKPERNPNA